jgi:hypothetical protein
MILDPGGKRHAQTFHPIEHIASDFRLSSLIGQSPQAKSSVSAARWQEVDRVAVALDGASGNRGLLCGSLPYASSCLVGASEGLNGKWFPRSHQGWHPATESGTLLAQKGLCLAPLL